MILVHNIVGHLPKTARLLDIANNVARRRFDYDLMSASIATPRTPATACTTFKLAFHTHHLLSQIVEYFYFKTTLRTATNAHTSVRIFDRIKHLLLCRIVYDIFVIGLPAHKSLKHAHLLLHKERVYLSKILKSGRDAGYCRWSLHDSNYYMKRKSFENNGDMDTVTSM